MSASSAVQQIMHLVLHATTHAYSNFSPTRSDSTLACVCEGARTGSIFQLTFGFIQAVAQQKLHHQFLRAIPLFMFTHDSSYVMRTICQHWLCLKIISDITHKCVGFSFFFFLEIEMLTFYPSSSFPLITISTVKKIECHSIIAL